jgi:kynurenine aminotransferase
MKFSLESDSSIIFFRYTRPEGHQRLVDELIATYSPSFGRKIISAEALVSIGAYQGIYWTFEAFIEAGDEIITFDPMFDAYHLNSKLEGAKCVPVPLKLEVSGASLKVISNKHRTVQFLILI